MGVQVKWDNTDQTIMRYLFESQWTWVDVIAANNEAHKMMDNIDHPVYLIIDLSQTSMIANNPLVNISRTRFDHPQMVGRMILGANNFVRHIWQVATKLYPPLRARHQLFSGTLAEAHAKILAELLVSQ